MKFKPHEYQQRAIAWIIERACAALFLDPGLGKTSIMLAAFHLLKKQKLVRKMLVIAPLRVMHSTWPAEARKWDEFKHLKIGILHGPTKSSVLFDESIDVHVINPEGLKWLFDRIDDPSELWQVLCVDESTKFKHTDTDRFKLLKPHLEKFGRRYILTGSPAPNGLLDLFGQVFILDLGASLGGFISHFRSNYFECYDGFTYTPQYGAENRIYAKLQPLALRMSQEEYLHLPPLVGACGYGEPLVRLVELPPEAMKIYKQMEDLMITELEDDKVVAANAAAVSGKCRQIANGGLYGSANLKGFKDERGQYEIHEAKLDATEEILEELQGTPALVAYEYGHDLDRLLKRFGKDTPWIGGGVGTQRFREIEAAWNRGEIPVLLAQPQSVSHGLNLQDTKAAVIWHSITWDLEVYEQFIKRVHRQGQKDKVFVHHVVAKDTIDETVVKLLQKKDKTQRALLTALRDAYVG